MNSEIISLDARAARHAALADTVRLRIVDALALGDLSPQELLGRLDIASNLLSHHLKVLESAALVTRTRSEGDRRRTYVTLNEGALSAAGPSRLLPARRVVFVCTANSARSQLAEHLWREHSDIPAASGGTVPTAMIARGAVDVASQHGIDLRGATPKLLADIAHEGDIRVTVCDSAHETIGGSDVHWSIPDPVAADTPAAFAHAYAELSRRIDALRPHIAAASAR